MDMAAEKEMAVALRAERRALRAARVRLSDAFFEVRKSDWSDQKIDRLFPYPFYKVDDKERAVTVANAIKISVTGAGQIRLKFLRPFGSRKFRSLEGLATNYSAQIYSQYRDVLDALFSDQRQIKKLPAAYLELLPLIEEVVALDGRLGRRHDLASLRSWLEIRRPFHPGRVAGLKNIDAVGRQIRILVSRFLEDMPVVSELKRHFNWHRPVRELDINVWNRLVQIAPFFVQLKADNKRLAMPYVLCHFWTWINEGKGESHLKWLNISPQEAISKWRSSLIDAGLTPASWRWITHLPVSQLSSLVTISPLDGGVLRALNHIVARQLPAQHSISFLKRSNQPILFTNFSANNPAVVGLFDALIRQRNQDRKIILGRDKERKSEYRRQTENKITDILDYLFPVDRGDERPLDAELAEINASWPTPDYEYEGERLKIPRAVNLSWFERKAQMWHDMMLPVWDERAAIIEAVYRLHEGGTPTKLNWQSALGACEIDSFEVVPLVSGVELAEEGVVMRHCVSGYTQICMRSGHRIFSIREAGQRVATLEIAPSARGQAWRVAQVRGKRNAGVPSQVSEVAEKIAHQYTQAVTRQ